MSHRDPSNTLDTRTEFVHSQGTTLSHTWRWRAGNEDVDTAGWTALFQIRAGYADAFPALYSVATGGVNEVQTVAITGSPTGGSFALTYSGQTTAAIAWNATAAAVQSALEALSNIAVGDVAVTGGPLPGTAVTVTFTGTLSRQNVALMTQSSAGLTGGTTPTVVVTETTAGIAGTGRIVLGIQTDTETTWNVQLDIPPSDLDIAGLPGGFVGFYELVLTSPSGVRVSFAKQRFCVSGAYADA